jgi:putative ABC transport system permease protein
MPEGKRQTDFIVESGNIEIAQGKLFEPSETGKVVLGNDFADKNYFGKEIKIGSTIKIQGEKFEVSGILERSSTFILNGVILMSEKDMKEILNIQDEIDLISVRVVSEDKVIQTAEELERKFRKDRNQKIGEEDFSVQTPLQALSSINSILSVINAVVAGIAAISLLVGGVGIANTMFTSVLERTKEIGVMKAIGAQNKDILTVFMTEAALLGLVGGIVGAGLGLTMAFTVSTVANSALGESIFQISPSPFLLLGSVAFSLVIGLISGIVPAIQASKLNPVDALRK